MTYGLFLDAVNHAIFHFNSSSRTNKSPPVFYRTSSPLGPLPCFLSFQFTTMQSRAMGIADHVLPLGYLLPFNGARPLRGRCSLMAEIWLFGQRPQRGRSPVEHRGTFVRLSVRPSIHPSPPGPLRPEICPIRPEIPSSQP